MQGMTVPQQQVLPTAPPQLPDLTDDLWGRVLELCENQQSPTDGVDCSIRLVCQRFCRLYDISRVELAPCRTNSLFVTSEELANNLTRFSALTKLDLARCNHEVPITDEVLAAVANLSRLASLRLQTPVFLHSDPWTLTGFSRLAVQRHGSLTELDLCACNITDKCLLVLQVRNTFSYADKAVVQRLLGLPSQQIRGPSQSSTPRASLQGVTSLQKLGLDRCGKLTNSGLELLAPLTGLRELDLSRTRIGNAGLQHVAKMASLEVLKLNFLFAITDDGVHTILAGLPWLRSLELQNGRRITDEVFAVAPANPAFEALDINGCTGLTDAAMLLLPAMKNLRHLDLSGCIGLAAGTLPALNQLEFLTGLELWRCRDIPATDLCLMDGLRHSLLYLGLGWLECITDVALHTLFNSGMPFALKALDLSGCHITVDGLRALYPLAETLSSLNLSCCRMLDDHEISTSPLRNLKRCIASIWIAQGSDTRPMLS